MPKWIIFSIMQIFMEVIQKEWVLTRVLFMKCLHGLLATQKSTQWIWVGKKGEGTKCQKIQRKRKNRRLKKESQLMKAKQRVFWGSQVLQVKAVPCSQHMQLIIQLDTDLGSMVKSNLFMGINCSSEYSSLPLASACLPSVSIQGFLVHLFFLSFFFVVSFLFFFFLHKY